MNNFATLVLSSACDLDDYQALLLEQCMDDNYKYYKLQLELLQSRYPTQRLVLKCPEHLWHLPSLVNNFPNATILWTHREKEQSIASYASLLSLTQRMLYGQYDAYSIGTSVRNIFEIGLRRAHQFKEENKNNDQILDLQCIDIAENPLPTIEKVCSFVNYKLTANERNSILMWLQRKRSDKLGAHQYNQEEFVHGSQ